MSKGWTPLHGTSSKDSSGGSGGQITKLAMRELKLGGKGHKNP